MKVCREKELNLCCVFLWRFKGVPVLTAGTLVILAEFQIARLMQGWHDRIPYRTGGFEDGFKLYY